MKQEIDKFPEGSVKIFVEWTSADGSSSFSFPAELGLTDEDNDIAILKTEAGGIRPFVDASQIEILKLADSTPSIGDEVIMSGYRGDEIGPFTVSGNISLISERTEPTNGLPPRTIFCDLTSLPGNSGAAILSAKSGDVVGVQLGALNWGTSATGMAYAANLSSIKKLLSEQRTSAPAVK